MSRVTLTLAALLCLVGSLMASDIPYMVNVQGKLTDETGTPLPDGDYIVTFTIYNACADGDVEWQQTRNVELVDGLFAEILGEDDRIISGDVALPQEVFNEAERCLGIKVGADPEMTPLQRIVAMPYAYYAETADYADTATYADTAGYANPAAGWSDAGSVVHTETPADFVGIGTSNPDFKLEVAGDVGIGGKLVHNDDHDTYLQYTIDQTDLYVGGVRLITLDETTQDQVVINEDRNDVDFRVESDIDDNALFVRGNDSYVGIGTSSPTTDLHVAGNIRFDFDTVWVESIAEGETKVFSHNLGGDPDRYIVFVDGKSDHASGWHQANFGTCMVNFTLGRYLGLEWRKLTSSSITLMRGNWDNRGTSGDWDEVRVRIIENQ